jgi:hypothetical protein
LSEGGGGAQWAISFNLVHQLRAKLSQNFGLWTKLNTLRELQKVQQTTVKAACSFYWPCNFRSYEFLVFAFSEKWEHK